MIIKYNKITNNINNANENINAGRIASPRLTRATLAPPVPANGTPTGTARAWRRRSLTVG